MQECGLPHPRLVRHFDALLSGIYDALRGQPIQALPEIEPLGDDWLSEMVELRHYDLQVAQRNRRLDEMRRRTGN